MYVSRSGRTPESGPRMWFITKPIANKSKGQRSRRSWGQSRKVVSQGDQSYMITQDMGQGRTGGRTRQEAG